MKNNKIILPFFLTLLLALTIIDTGCKNKDEDNEPQDVKTYNGITDQDLNIQVSTGMINGELFLLSYDFKVIYADGQHYEEQELSKYNSEGLTKITGNQLNYNLGDPESYITGYFTAALDSLDGNYSYKFVNIGKTASGQFWTLKQ